MKSGLVYTISLILSNSYSISLFYALSQNHLLNNAL